MKAKVLYHQDAIPEKAGEGVTRRILAYTEEMMMVEVLFEKGGIGSVHTHPHTQCTYVQSGRFRFTIDGNEVEVGPGDTIAFPPDVPHGTVCLDAGILLDVFTPMRKDFL